MNKHQEALGFLREKACENYFRKYMQTCEERATIFKSAKYLQELVERATPKKPDVNINNGFCPNCNYAFGLERTRQAMLKPYWLSFCPCCGQALDWSKE